PFSLPIASPSALNLFSSAQIPSRPHIPLPSLYYLLQYTRDSVPRRFQARRPDLPAGRLRRHQGHRLRPFAPRRRISLRPLPQQTPENQSKHRPQSHHLPRGRRPPRTPSRLRRRHRRAFFLHAIRKNQTPPAKLRGTRRRSKTPRYRIARHASRHGKALAAPQPEREGNSATGRKQRMTAVIRTHDLVKRYRKLTALDGVALEVQEGAVYALVGQNGAGKTTAIKILMNLISATKGTAQVLGTDSRKIGGKSYTQIGYVSENQEIPEWMKVGALLDYLRAFYPTWDLALEQSLVKQFDLPLDR